MDQEFGERPGKLRNRYTVRSLIARGGMAEVYRAHDEFLGRDVAVKVFRASATAETDFRRQEDEVNVLARLNHPNLVTLLDAAVDRSDAQSPRIYYVMELVEGTDLKRRLDDGPLGGRQVAQLGYDVATALEHVHGKGIVHRDVKPANILITFNDDGSRVDAKLGDFGVASVGPAGPIADDEVVTGTVAYLSPEQARGEEVTTASDIYSLGLVLLQCFTGELAFPGPPQHSAMARLLDDPVIPEGIPADWPPLLKAMTARQASDRPDIHDVALALRQMFASETGRHKATSSALVDDEAARMAAVHRYNVLDTPTDGTFDRITALAARVIGTPIAIVSIVDSDRIWFKSHHGLEIEQIDREPGLCASAIMNNTPWVVEDARLDPRALSNPLVAGEFGLQFYAGVPLTSHDGFNLGTLCVLDFEPRQIGEDDLSTLEDLAAMVMRELELRRQAQELLRNQPTRPADADWQDSLTSSDVRSLGAAPMDAGDAIITNRPFYTSDGLLATNAPLPTGQPVSGTPPTGPVELTPAT